jgi:hypothetical protein
MSKGLRNMPDAEKKATVERRLLKNTNGLGYFAACDAKGIPIKKD